MSSFNNLEIISNEVPPESYHISLDGDVYEFKHDYHNEYFRQEAVKLLYQYNYHNIRYDGKFVNHPVSQRMLSYRPNYPVADKSVLFPLYYGRVDTYDEIEDSYQRMLAPSCNYQYMSGTEKNNTVSSGGLIIDDDLKEVSVDGRIVKLTPIEYKILLFLLTNQGKVFSINQIYENVWNEEAIGADNTVAVHIRHIREKIEINPKEPRYLKVVWGVGYKIEKID